MDDQELLEIIKDESRSIRERWEAMLQFEGSSHELCDEDRKDDPDYQARQIALFLGEI